MILIEVFADYFTVTLNGQAQQYDRGDISPLIIADAGGNDTLSIVGSDADEIGRLEPHEIKFYDDGNLLVDASGIESIQVDAGQGVNKALLFDSVGNDRVFMQGTSARLYGPGYDNRATNFQSMTAIAQRGGHDEAFVLDTDQNESFISTPSIAMMIGDDYMNRAIGFNRLQSLATLGEDQAILFDSPGNDRAFVSQGLARMVGPRKRTTTVRGFDTVQLDASSGGVDRIDIYDTPQDDKLEVNADNVKLFTDIDDTDGVNYDLLAQAYYFARVNAHGHRGGTNVKDENADEQQRLYELAYYGDWEAVLSFKKTARFHLPCSSQAYAKLDVTDSASFVLNEPSLWKAQWK